MMRVISMLRLGVMAAAMSFLAGCGLNLASPRTSLLWGPVHHDMSSTGLPVLPAPAPTSRAAQLREELLPSYGFRSDAPNQKDWRFVRGRDKGPMIFGAALRLNLSEGGGNFRLGAVKRGANRTFGPQMVLSFKPD